MNDKNIHRGKIVEAEEKLFAQGKIVWEKSEDDVWAELESKIDKKEGRVVQWPSQLGQWVAVAAIFILVGLLGVVSTYYKEAKCLPGERLVVDLPDGSTVDLNSGSTLRYYPLKWRFERTLKFEGEGYFNVQKGEKFTVESNNGITQVLGTSFNVYARDDKYRVTCLTGKVKVSSKHESVILLPRNHAEIEEGKLVVTQMFKPENTISWTNNFFSFAGRPFKEVIDEIERQYAVTIKLDPQLNNRNFGSNFSKKNSVEDVLNIVCKVMDVKFVKQADNVYLVVEES